MRRRSTKATVGIFAALCLFLLPASLGHADERAEGFEDAPAVTTNENSPSGSLDDSLGALDNSESADTSDQQIEGSHVASVPDVVDPVGRDGNAVEGRRSLESAAKSVKDGAPEKSAKSDQAPVQSYSGATMFETAVAEAKAAYLQGCESAIIVGPGIAWIDALSATGLAASRGPILFTEHTSLHPATKQALADLGVKSVIVIGGSASVASSVEQEIVAAGMRVEARLGGADCYDTQMKIYEYGYQNSLWDTSSAIVVTGGHYGDALSVSPVAFANRTPIFLVESGAALRDAQMQALAQGARRGEFSSVVIVGGPAAVSMETEGFVSGVAYCNGGSYTRLRGSTQYETSAEVAKWAVSSQGFTWDSLAFATGLAPYDALAGSVLQGGSRSVLLLVDGSNLSTVNEAEKHKGQINHVRFLGGSASVPQALRDSVVSRLGIQKAVQPNSEKLVEGDTDAASYQERA